MNKATGDKFLVNGKEIVSEVKFVPDSPTGEVMVAFTFDASGITDNTDIVAFESLSKDGIELTVHADIEDKSQTVTVLIPEIETMASVNGEKLAHSVKSLIMEDIVRYENLIVGKEYTLRGILMDKSTGDPLLVDGETVDSEITFIPKAHSGEIAVTFTFDASAITKNTDVVVFEMLYLADAELTSHKNIEDEGQTVTILVPKICTVAEIDGDKVTHPYDYVTIKDTVVYENLIVGREYTLQGILMDKVTGAPFFINGERVESEITFVPESQTGEVAVTFILDASAISTNTDIVVFENLYLIDVELTSHADIDDEGQTVTVLVPQIGTTAEVDGAKQTHPYGSVTIDDTIDFENLIEGKEYTLRGILMNKVTGEPFIVNGNIVESKIGFIPRTQSGRVTVSFTFDASTITANTDIVVFETLYHENTELAIHADIDDESQTVTVLTPEIGTVASVNGEKDISATEVFMLEDVVHYENLIVGKEYTVRGVLMNKTTGESLIANGETVESKVVFIPNTPSGEVTVTFTFDSKFFKAETDIVVFETIYSGDSELAVHADINDENQTVHVHIPEIGTQASVDGKKNVTTNGEITIEDIVSYKNLTSDVEYTISGILMNKLTGEPFLVNGAEICSEVTFVPETPNGEVKVNFMFSTDSILSEIDVVVFETLSREGVEIAIHADIDDEGQTVKIIPPTPDTPKTGDDSNLALWLVIMGVSFLTAIIFGITYLKTRKSNK